MKTKICTRCKEEKPLSSFVKQKKSKDGLRYWCTACESKQFRGWWLLSRYGITVEDYNEMFEAQQGCCEICGRHQSEVNRTFDVDHNHETGKVRGLLCFDCNRGLGCVKENTTILAKAIEYLNKYNESV